jgi:hypothetical protein
VSLNNVLVTLVVSCRDKLGVDLLICRPRGRGSRAFMIGSDSPSKRAALVNWSREELR